MEFSLHDWEANPISNSHPVEAGACGFDVQFLSLPSNIRLQIYQRQSRGDQYAVCQITLSSLPRRFAYIRYQHIPQADNGASGMDTCEAWDIEGKRFSFDSKPYKGFVANPDKVVSAGGGSPISLGFLRLFTTTVPMGSRPPVNADRGDLLEWRFNGNLNDDSGHGRNGELSGGLVSYVPTPGQDLVVAAIRTSNAPPWSDWIPLNTGLSQNEVDCNQSYSQADDSATVQCEWSITGPTQATIDNPSATNPLVSGLAFGTYNFALKVTDSTGRATTSHMNIGAVNYDSHGKVQHSNSNVEKIFGPMIALGQNPWGYADERAKRMVELQHEYFLGQGLDRPVWATPGRGTVSYIYAGIGPSPSRPGTTLTQDISAQQQTLQIADAGRLPGLTSLPTWLVVGNSWGTQELVRICSASSLNGPATLTVCYDGRGLSGLMPYVPQTVRQAWAAGTIVGEYRVQGTGTSFISDPDRPICPGGAPGPPGPVVYSQGQAVIGPAGTRILGANTSWNAASGVFAGRYIRIEATHRGEPFVYWSRIAAVDNENSLTVDRPLPEDMDPGAYSYKIIGYRYISLEFVAPDGAVQNGLQFTQGCESEDRLFAMATHDLPSVNQLTQSNLHFSYKDNLGIQSAFGPNFYGSGLAARAVYFRSGWDLAKQTADIIDEMWVRDPEIAGGWRGGIPLLQGGAVVGAFADLITNPDTKLLWSDVRAFARTGAGLSKYSCSSIDTRDSGYLTAWLALAANFDPDPGQREIWIQAMQRQQAWDEACKQSDYSWANGFVFNSASPALTLEPGSAVARGNNLSPSLCFGTARGTVQVSHGSSIISGTGLVPGAKIVLTGIQNGKSFVGSYQFKLTDNGQGAVLSVLWPGDTGEAGFVIENHEFVTTIAKDNEDPQLRKHWACTYVSNQELLLNRPWDGDPSTQAHIYSYAVAGFGQQPYMLGIKITAMNWASQNADSSVAANYRQWSGLAAQWIHDTGFDPSTQGLYYGRIYPACEPQTEPADTLAFDYRTPGCSMGLTRGAIRAARTLTGEASGALSAYFQANPTKERRDWGDLAYGSIWGYCPYTKPGYYCDPNYVRDENSDLALGAYKWPGFFFGMGMAHQWPAVRTQDLPDASPRRR